MTGTVTLAGSTKLRGLALSTGATNALVGSGGIAGVDVDQVSVTTTNGTAVNLTNAVGSYVFSSVSTNAAANGSCSTRSARQHRLHRNRGGNGRRDRPERRRNGARRHAHDDHRLGTRRREHDDRLERLELPECQRRRQRQRTDERDRAEQHGPSGGLSISGTGNVGTGGTIHDTRATRFRSRRPRSSR